MRILVDVVAATTGGGLSRSRELARSLPALGPEDDHLFVAQGAVREAVREVAPDVQTLVPARPFSRPPLRLAWEHLAVPRLARHFEPDVVFSPFNIVPTRWPTPAPKLAVVVSNLAPYVEEFYSLYGGVERLRLQTLRRLTDRTLARADRVLLLSQAAYSLIDGREGRRLMIPHALIHNI